METIANVLMRRDGVSEEEARKEVIESKKHIKECVEDGTSIEETVEEVLDDLGLEIDYAMELIL